MKELKLSQVAQALGCHCDIQDRITNICTDSREVTKGSLFIAIKGEQVDGHDYVAKALAQGASGVLVEVDRDYNSQAVLHVENTVVAMLDLARWYRTQVSATIIAITGSVGKTTTKDMVSQVLQSTYSTIKTQGNQNNEIGTPRTIMSIEPDTQMAVVEMGMSGFDEIRSLAQAAKPHIGIITNIGVSHMELLGSRENILKAKLELADCLADGSDLFLCSDNDLLATVEIPRLHIIFYGIDSDQATLRGEIIGTTADSTSFYIHWNKETYMAKIPGAGKHLVQNALVAFGIGIKMGIAPVDAIKALEQYQPSGMRQHVVEKNGVTVVEDCYNASPDSVMAAIATMKDFQTTGKKYMVLSDMLELGNIAKESHYHCGKAVADSGTDCLVAIGELARHYAQGAIDGGMSQVMYFQNKDQASEYLSTSIKRGDVVWFKASRGMALEECIQCLYAHL